MVQVELTKNLIIRQFHPTELVAGLIPGRLEQRRKECALVEVVAATFQQRQFCPFLRSEVVDIPNLIMDVVKDQRWVAA